MTAVQLAGLALTALLSENFILVSCLGIGTRTQSFQDPVDAWRTGYSLTLVMILTVCITWPMDLLLFTHQGWGYFRTLAFALAGPAVVAGLRCFFRVCLPELSRRMDGNLASISTNCAAMGCALLISQRGYSLEAALLYALGGGVGATLALMSFAGLLGEVSLTSCPKCFRGLPIKLVTAGLMAMALVGFYGLHLG